MKKKYFTPEMEIVEFEVEDVIGESDSFDTGSAADGEIANSDDF